MPHQSSTKRNLRSTKVSDGDGQKVERKLEAVMTRNPHLVRLISICSILEDDGEVPEEFCPEDLAYMKFFPTTLVDGHFLCIRVSCLIAVSRSTNRSCRKQLFTSHFGQFVSCYNCFVGKTSKKN